MGDLRSGLVLEPVRGQQGGYPPQQGYPPQGYPPQGYPPQGYPPQQGQYQGQPPPQQGQYQGQQPPRQAGWHPAGGQPPSSPPAGAPEGNELQVKLQKLKAAFEAGLLTDEEYSAKKATLLESF
jgi:hypothetical protein